jgi:hypothetical protein
MLRTPDLAIHDPPLPSDVCNSIVRPLSVQSSTWISKSEKTLSSQNVRADKLDLTTSAERPFKGKLAYIIGRQASPSGVGSHDFPAKAGGGINGSEEDRSRTGVHSQVQADSDERP